MDGPHKLRFSPGDEALAEAKSLLATLGDSMIEFAEHQDEHTFLMFTSLFSMRDSLREIRYSVDGLRAGRAGRDRCRAGPGKARRRGGARGPAVPDPASNLRAQAGKGACRTESLD